MQKRWLALVLGLAASPLWASTFPNNYTNSVSYSFDPNLGSSGTLYLNYTYTGTTQPSMMCNQGAVHYPHLQVKMVNNGVDKTRHYAGDRYNNGVAPCVQMNQTLTVAFDLGSDECTLDLLINGTCAITEEQNGVWCTIAGEFVFLLRKFQFEYAHAQMQTVGTTYPFPQQPNCEGLSNPPDWWIRNGLTYGTTGYRNAAAEVVRSQFLGLSFTGQPWFQIQPFGFPVDVPAGPPVICTQNDHGCVWGATSCTGTPTK